MVTRRLNPIPLDDFPMPGRPWTNIAPFTYRDGSTYLKVLEDLRGYIFNVLVPHINSEMEGIEDWNTEAIEELIASVQALTSELDDRLTAEMAALEATVDSRIEAHGENIEAELNAALVEVHQIVQNYLADVTTQLNTFRTEVLSDVDDKNAAHSADVTSQLNAAISSATADLDSQLAAQNNAVTSQLAAQDARVDSAIGDMTSDVAAQLLDILAEVDTRINAAIAQIQDDSFIAALINAPGSETRDAIMSMIAAGGVFSDEAVGALIRDADSDTRAALAPLLTDDASIATLVNASSATRAAIDSAIDGKISDIPADDVATDGDVAALVSNTGSATSAALNSAIDGKIAAIPPTIPTSDVDVAAWIEDTDSATREAIDGILANLPGDAVSSDADVAALIGSASETQDALGDFVNDRIETGLDPSVAGLVTDPTDTRAAVDARVADGIANIDISTLNVAERPAPAPPANRLAIPAVNSSDSDVVIQAVTNSTATVGGTIPVRQDGGHIRVPVDPSVSGDAASKYYVDLTSAGTRIGSEHLDDLEPGLYIYYRQGSSGMPGGSPDITASVTSSTRVHMEVKHQRGQAQNTRDLQRVVYHIFDSNSVLTAVEAYARMRLSNAPTWSDWYAAGIV